LPNDIILLEIFHEQALDIVNLCKERMINTKCVFVKPLSDDDYKIAGCSMLEEDKSKREAVTCGVMLTKLTNRATETRERIVGRAMAAFDEIENHDQKIYVDLVNHYGEDNRYLWLKLKEYVSQKGGLEFALRNEALNGIASTFSEFLEKIGL